MFSIKRLGLLALVVAAMVNTPSALAHPNDSHTRHLRQAHGEEGGRGTSAGADRAGERGGGERADFGPATGPSGRPGAGVGSVQERPVGGVHSANTD
jgi:hypothetical protein